MHKRASKAVFPPGRAASLYGKNVRVEATPGSTNSISKSLMGLLRADPITMILLSWWPTLRSGNIFRSTIGDRRGDTNIPASHALLVDAPSLESDHSA